MSGHHLLTNKVITIAFTFYSDQMTRISETCRKVVYSTHTLNFIKHRLQDYSTPTLLDMDWAFEKNILNC